jgi:membrane associated rhomboid family serine protease
MGIYDRPYFQDDKPRGFSLDGPRSMVTNLILINVGIYLANALLTDLDLNRYLGVSPETLRKPWLWWQFVTYGFAHDNHPMHLIGNMLGLFFFGRDLEQRYGSRRFLGMYLTSILAGSLVWTLTNLAVDPGQSGQMRLIGASGGVTTVIVLFAILYPRRTVLLMFLIPIPAWVLGLLIVFSNLQGYQQGGSRVAFDVHLVGAAYAWIFYRTQWELGQYLSPGWAQSLRRLRPHPHLRVHRPPRQDHSLAEQADAVLDKLHRQGETSLTPRERRVLEEYSRRLQQKNR